MYKELKEGNKNMSNIPTDKEGLIAYLKAEAGQVDEPKIIPTEEPIFTIPASGAPSTTAIQAEMREAAQASREAGEDPYAAFGKIIGAARSKITPNF